MGGRPWVTPLAPPLLWVVSVLPMAFLLPSPISLVVGPPFSVGSPHFVGVLLVPSYGEIRRRRGH